MTPSRLSGTTAYCLTHCLSTSVWLLLQAFITPHAAAMDHAPEEYFASGSTSTITCNATAGSSWLTCSQIGDFALSQGVMLKGGGYLPHGAAYPVTPAPTVTPSNTASGSETYCYRVAVADPFEGIQAASAPTCLSNQPVIWGEQYHMVTVKRFTDSLAANGITPSNAIPGYWAYARTIPVYLFYLSHNGSPYELIDVNNDPNRDVTILAAGESRPNGNFGGWPLVIPDTLNEGVIQRGNLFGRVLRIAVNSTTGSYRVNIGRRAPVTGTFELFHDDTDAIQSAIDNVTASGGGTVSLLDKTYPVRKPYFNIDQRSGQSGYVSDLYVGSTLVAWWAMPSHLHISTGAYTNGLRIAGTVPNAISTIQTGADIDASLLSILTPTSGNLGIPPVADQSHPISILPANKGDTSISLANPSDASRLTVGADIYLFTGSFKYGSPVGDPSYKGNADASGTNFSELNTITAIDSSSGVVSLALPLNKKYWSDGYNAFGVSQLAEQAPRNITLQNLTLDTYQKVLSQGPVFNLEIDHMASLHPITGNAMGTGYKRGLSITNSSWQFGNGLRGWSSVNEFDKAADVVFTGNTVQGYAGKFAEGPSQGAKVWFSEGVTNLTVANNHFIGVQLITDQSDDVRVENNLFEDSMAWIGTQEHDLWNGNWGYVSFGSQHNAKIDNNHFVISSNYGPAWVVYLGNFDGQASIQGNTIDYNQTKSPLWMIYAASGTIAHNTINDTPAPQAPLFMSSIMVATDVTPNRAAVQQNIVSSTRWPDVTEVLPVSQVVVPLDICVSGNVLNGAPGDDVYVRGGIWLSGQNYNFQSRCTP